MEKKQLSHQDYARAENFLSWNLKNRVYNIDIKPNWNEENETFWYLNRSKKGKEFKIGDPKADTLKPAFDQKKMAEVLSVALGKAIEPWQLPFETITILDDNKIKFNIDKQAWVCNLKDYSLEETTLDLDRVPGHLPSPNKEWLAFKKGFDLYVKKAANGEEIRLTNDGKKHYDYAGSPESNTMHISLQKYAAMIPPFAVWSPDSKKLVTQRLDQRKVKDLNLLQFSPEEGQRPVLHTYKYAMPGDKELVKEEIYILDVETQKSIKADLPPIYVDIRGTIEWKYIWWSKDSNKFFLLVVERYHKTMRLFEIDASTGKSRQIIEETTTNTFIEPSPWIGGEANIRIIKDNSQVIWYSSKDGWGNLYLYDAANGKELNKITQSPILVYEIKHVDEENDWVYFQGGCHEPDHDPYYQHLYRAKLDGSEMQLLTPEDANHLTSFSPKGNYFLESHSRMDQAPITLLRKCDGTLIRVVEEADISELLKMSWKAPEPFVVKACDNFTDNYGVIFRPSNFDPAKSYPVIDSIYPGPQHVRTPKGFEFDDFQAIAELGFIVVTIDGRGNMGRSKANHDLSYNNQQDPGCLEDHIFGLQQLADRYPWMDLNRVGIAGHSGGGNASVRAIFTYPDFYKVAVASAGNHDQRGYLTGWGERYHGPMEGDNYEAQNNANPELVKNFKGKLLIAAGDMDDNVHPAMTMQVIDSLIKANKDFDMLLLPNCNHSFVRTNVYFKRKRWDYFVEHLMGAVPPSGYEIDASKIPPLQLDL